MLRMYSAVDGHSRVKFSFSETSSVSSDSLNSYFAPTPPSTPTDPMRTHAEMLAAEAADRAARRRIELEELRSDLKTPEQRIHEWERVHQLRMPLKPNHPILDVIAVDTRLTLEQVQAIQKQAAMRATRVAG
ncbi:MAG TPA: hypothetical protein VEV18_03895 [Steroidobacteraceae bacterium]|nr:hypothetical protein [Steroidobacteraceae bacterium]